MIIPVYNHGESIAAVIESAKCFVETVFVVNDGSTDRTRNEIDKMRDQQVEVISYEKNRGKGYALGQGFRQAWERGFTHAVTMDADGQHLATDISILIEKAKENPTALIVGSRTFDHPNMPEGNKFANRFSNFWFRVQTGVALPDTQTGFRVYPLQKMGKMHLFSNRYEAELEILVRCAWRNIQLIPQPIQIYYPPQNERISHFRKGKDFIRISVLNTFLCLFSIIYGYPSRCLRKIFKR